MKIKLSLSACIVVLMAGLVSCKKESRPVVVTGAEILQGTESVGMYLVTNVDSLSYLTVNVEPADATENLIWEIEDESVITEYNRDDDTGRKVSLIALSAGETVVRLTTESGFKAEFQAIVYANPPKLKGLQLSPESMTLKVGESAGVMAIVTPPDAQEQVFFEILDPTILEYDWEENGEYLFSAVKVGKARILATCGEFTAVCDVNVVTNLVSLTDVKLAKTQYSVPVGERFEIKPAFTPSNASNKVLKWEMENGDIAEFEGTVDGTADFIAKNIGTTTVTGTSLDGNFTVSATIKVTPPTPPDGGVDLGYRYGEKPVYFHKYNLCSTTAYSVGYYFPWGVNSQYFDREGPNYVRWLPGKTTGYSKESYHWYDSNLKTYTKYGTRVGEYSLELEDDPAHRILGSNWRMPNVADLFWLKKNCIWNVDYDHLAFIVTSTVPGFEDQSIIVPMTGYFAETDYHGYGQIVKGGVEPFMTILASSGLYYNGDGTYSAEDINVLSCHMISFSGKIYDDVILTKDKRYYGFTIRPVWQTGMLKSE